MNDILDDQHAFNCLPAGGFPHRADRTHVTGRDCAAAEHARRLPR
jgi:hypothetical protein